MSASSFKRYSSTRGYPLDPLASNHLRRTAPNLSGRPLHFANHEPLLWSLIVMTTCNAIHALIAMVAPTGPVYAEQRSSGSAEHLRILSVPDPCCAVHGVAPAHRGARARADGRRAAACPHTESPGATPARGFYGYDSNSSNFCMRPPPLALGLMLQEEG